MRQGFYILSFSCLPHTASCMRLHHLIYYLQSYQERKDCHVNWIYPYLCLDPGMYDSPFQSSRLCCCF